MDKMVRGPYATPRLAPLDPFRGTLGVWRSTSRDFYGTTVSSSLQLHLVTAFAHQHRQPSNTPFFWWPLVVVSLFVLNHPRLAHSLGPLFVVSSRRRSFSRHLSSLRCRAVAVFRFHSPKLVPTCPSRLALRVVWLVSCDLPVLSPLLRK
jgi:hypothetical protein